MLAKHAGMDFYLQGKSCFARLVRDHLDIYNNCRYFKFHATMQSSDDCFDSVRSLLTLLTNDFLVHYTRALRSPREELVPVSAFCKEF